MGRQLYCDVDWEIAPSGTAFYSEGYFRNEKGDWWSETWGRWCSTQYTLEELLQANDYESKPEDTKMEYTEWERLIEDDPVCTPEANTGGGAIKPEWTATHYDNYYQLTEADIKVGKVKVDAYFVNKMWKLNQKDDTGGLFHSLKTIARFGEKNTIERELKALYNQTKRMAELYGVELE